MTELSKRVLSSVCLCLLAVCALSYGQYSATPSKREHAIDGAFDRIQPLAMSGASEAVETGPIDSKGKGVIPDTVRQRIERILQERFSYYESFFQDLHQYPELAFLETRTSARLADELRGLGFEVTTDIGRTGLVAVLRNGPGPTVMLRTEIDALPVQEDTNLPYRSKIDGVDHACGHDLHMTVNMAAAYAMIHMKDAWHGTLVVIGQPAEEIVSGAKAMIEDGLFTRFPKPDYVLSIHTRASTVSGKIGYRAGYIQSAADGFHIILYGKGGHGARPDRTIDPIMMAAELLTKFQILRHEANPLVPNVISVGYIHAGTAQNIIPPSAEIKGTIRTYTPEDRQFLKRRVEEVTRDLAASYHAPPPKIEFPNGTPAIYNDPTLSATLAPVLEAAVGKGNVLGDDLTMPSDDFAEFSAQGGMPGMKFTVGVTPNPGPDTPDNHSPQFVVDFEPSFKSGFRSMVASAIFLASNQTKTQVTQNEVISCSGSYCSSSSSAAMLKSWVLSVF